MGYIKSQLFDLSEELGISPQESLSRINKQGRLVLMDLIEKTDKAINGDLFAEQGIKYIERNKSHTAGLCPKCHHPTGLKQFNDEINGIYYLDWCFHHDKEIKEFIV